jgi:copper oxidase (laccase) domain-containing protein
MQSIVWETARTQIPALSFRRLSELGFEKHAFAVRQPGVEVRDPRDEALRRLSEPYSRLRDELGLGDRRVHFAEQVHGEVIAVVPENQRESTTPVIHPGADALISRAPNVCLGIYTADCCAVFIVDPLTRAVGLVHSGAKGTALRIVSKTLALMHSQFGCEPARLVVVLSPCVRPPLYEVDFASAIRQECERAGVAEVWDGGECTGLDTERYYSYRVEKGLTGRMLALLGI